MDFAMFLQFILGGLTGGSIYALMGTGFVIIYNGSNLINFAQGEFAMLGALVMVTFVQLASFSFPVALVMSIAVAVVGGAILERWAIRVARRATEMSLVVITIGAAITMRGIALLIWGGRQYTLPPLTKGQFSVLGANMTYQSLWIIIIAIIALLLLSLFMNKTLWGKGFKASIDNPLGARLVAINPTKVRFLSFSLGAAYGALAGILVAPLVFASYEMGVMLGLKGFVSAVFGSFGSIPGAVAGGFILGLLESLGAGFISSQFKNVFAFIIMLLILFLRPQGLFGGSQKREKV